MDCEYRDTGTCPMCDSEDVEFVDNMFDALREHPANKMICRNCGLTYLDIFDDYYNLNCIDWDVALYPHGLPSRVEPASLRGRMG